jgi:GH24 family phage-related lysozyme (muramidase)
MRIIKIADTKLRVIIASDLIAKQDDWYIKYALSQQLLREAGWKENITMSIMAAILMVLGGSTIYSAAQRHNLKEETLQKALNNRELIERAKQTQKYKGLGDLDAHPMSPDLKKPTHPLKPTQKEIQPNREHKSKRIPMTPSDISPDDIYQFVAGNECYKDKDGNPILSLKAYLDPSKKNMAIGAGFNLDRPQAKQLIKDMGLDYDKIRRGEESLKDDKQAKKLFDYDAKLAQNIAKRFVNNYEQLPAKMKLVLVDMAYNMGENRLFGFKDFKKAIESNDFQQAALEMKDSNWYSQVKGRGKRSVDLVSQLAPSRERPQIAKL